MTGYGKAECLYKDIKIVVEIRSVNGKSSDVGLKTQAIPREREYEVRQLVSSALMRGSIDLFATVEHAGSNGTRTINRDVFLSYYNQIMEINSSLLVYKERFPERSVQAVFCVASPDVAQNFQEMVAEATGATPVLLETKGVVTPGNNAPGDQMRLFPCTVAIGASLRSL